MLRRLDRLLYPHLDAEMEMPSELQGTEEVSNGGKAAHFLDMIPVLHLYLHADICY